MAFHPFACRGSGESSVLSLFAGDITDKSVAARSGLRAWKAVQTMTLDGRNGRRRQSASHSYDANVRQEPAAILGYLLGQPRKGKSRL